MTRHREEAEDREDHKRHHQIQDQEVLRTTRATVIKDDPKET